MTLHMTTFIDNEINKFSECTNMFCFGNSLKKSIKNMQYQKPHSVYFLFYPNFFPIEHFFLKHHLHLLRHLYPRRNHCLRLGSFDMFRPHILDGISETGGNQIQDVDIVKPVINGLSAKA